MIIKKIHGIFIGIDKYQSPEITELNCCSKDAKYLWALLKDTFPQGEFKKLINCEATCSNISEVFDNIIDKVSDEDLVIFHFSGHGSPNFHLVAHDTDINNFNATSISPDQVAGWIKRFKNKRLLVMLDCCFSGGTGAKVVELGVLKRDISDEENDLLELIKGEGALLIAAASSEQSAWENNRVGHGLLTASLISVFINSDHVLPGKSISLLQLADLVTKNIELEAKRIGKKQTPYIAFQSLGSLEVPFFFKGKHWFELNPVTESKQVTSDLNNLKIFKIPQNIIEIWKQDIPTLNPLQQKAINEAKILEGGSSIIIAPTSSGKTFIGEIAAIKTALIDQKKCIYLVPMKALVNDKYHDFSRKYSEFGIRIARSCGDIQDNDLEIAHNKFDIAIFTNEKFLYWLLANPQFIERVGLVVIDELQLVTEGDRGISLEFLLTLLREARNQNNLPQLIGWSATIGDLNSFDKWLNAVEIRSVQRPIPLFEGTMDYSGNFHYLDNENKEKDLSILSNLHRGKSKYRDIIIPLVKKLISKNERVIVFRKQRSIVRSCARYLSDCLSLPPAQEVIDRIPKTDSSLSTQSLIDVLKKGVAFHNSDLTRIERQTIEDDFRSPIGQIKVIVATPTLAMGINTPANTIIIAELEHPGKTPTPYSVPEYKNMIGRAGRLGITNQGKAITVVLSQSEAYKIWNSYIKANPLELKSAFQMSELPLFIVRVLSTAQELTLEDIKVFIKNSFAMYTLKPIAIDNISKNIEKEVNSLVEADFVNKDKGNYYLSELGKACGKEGLQINSAIRVSSYLKSIHEKSISVKTIVAATCLTHEINDIFVFVNMRSLKEKQRWPKEVLMHLSSYSYWETELRRLVRNDDYSRLSMCKKLSAILSWINGASILDIENHIHQHYYDHFASGAVQQVTDRCKDVLNPVATIIAFIYPKQNNIEEMIERLTVRLQVGVPDKIVDLVRITKANFLRPTYIALHKMGIYTLAEAQKREKEIVALLGEEEVNALLKYGEDMKRN
jgi:replicative superfamily II helicase